ncbi:MAG: hypothetical protein ACKV2Q_24650 [Planctomycetaceae bacterium]
MQFIEGQTTADVIQNLRALRGLDSADGAGDEFPPLAAKEVAAKQFADAVAALDVTQAGSNVDRAARTSKRRPLDSTSSVIAGMTTDGSGLSKSCFRLVAQFGVQVAEALDLIAEVAPPDSLVVRRLSDGAEVARIGNTGRESLGFQFTSDGRFLLGNTILGEVRVWDLSRLRQRLQTVGLDWDDSTAASGLRSEGLWSPLDSTAATDDFRIAAEAAGQALAAQPDELAALQVRGRAREFAERLRSTLRWPT